MRGGRLAGWSPGRREREARAEAHRAGGWEHGREGRTGWERARGVGLVGTRHVGEEVSVAQCARAGGVSVSERHPAGPHLAGSFRGWDALKMTLQADGTYSYTEHGVAAHGPIEFKFLNIQDPSEQVYKQTISKQGGTSGVQERTANPNNETEHCAFDRCAIDRS